MRSFTVGRITGIPIRVNVTLLVFLPVLAWLIGSEAQIELYAGLIDRISPHPVEVGALTAGSTPIAIGIAAALGLFVGVLLHELGHAWTARRYGIPIASITLWIFGGLARMEELPEDWNVEFWVALAGPAASVAIGLVCYAALFVVPAQPVVIFLVGWLAVVNVTLAVFNMIPAFPMDGGRILRALLARSRPYAEATSTAAGVGRALAVAMAIVGIFALAPLLVLVALFVYVAAGAESRATTVRELLSDVTAADLAEDVGTVGADESVADLLDRMLSDRRTGYPVVGSDGSLAGVVSLPALRTVPTTDRDRRTVEEVMVRSPAVIPADASAADLFDALATSPADRVVVVDGNRIVGTVSNEDVMEYLELIQGIGSMEQRDVAPPEGYA